VDASAFACFRFITALGLGRGLGGADGVAEVDAVGTGLLACMSFLLAFRAIGLAREALAVEDGIVVDGSGPL
jgi:hypothetical protein